MTAKATNVTIVNAAVSQDDGFFSGRVGEGRTVHGQCQETEVLLGGYAAVHSGIFDLREVPLLEVIFQSNPDITDVVHLADVPESVN